MLTPHLVDGESLNITTREQMIGLYQLPYAHLRNQKLIVLIFTCRLSPEYCAFLLKFSTLCNNVTIKNFFHNCFLCTLIVYPQSLIQAMM